MRPLRHMRREERIGSGTAAFARAREMLFRYTFYPPSIVSAPGPIVAGTVLYQRVRVGPLRFDGPVRVLATWDEPARAGYRYEALPGHAERGVATFEITLVEDEVRFRIESESAMAHWLARAGEPLARMVQRRAIDGAFKRMRAAAGNDA